MNNTSCPTNYSAVLNCMRLKCASDIPFAYMEEQEAPYNMVQSNKQHHKLVSKITIEMTEHVSDKETCSVMFIF